MPRSARLVLPGIPFHVTQRGINRAAMFVDDDDRRHYFRLLREAAARHDSAVHAWVLMGNHVHLLLTPSHDQSLARTMKRCSQLYAQAFNRRHQRSGPLVQGRFHSSPVQTERYFLEVLRYIELNPVRAGMVAEPTQHPWSSVHVHLANRSDGLVRVHPQFALLGPTPAARAETYAGWLRNGIDAKRLARIRECLHRGLPLGGAGFRNAVLLATGRPVEPRRRGRPPKVG
jgi:putative transposase